RSRDVFDRRTPGIAVHAIDAHLDRGQRRDASIGRVDLEIERMIARASDQEDRDRRALHRKTGAPMVQRSPLAANPIAMPMPTAIAPATIQNHGLSKMLAGEGVWIGATGSSTRNNDRHAPAREST